MVQRLTSLGSASRGVLGRRGVRRFGPLASGALGAVLVVLAAFSLWAAAASHLAVDRVQHVTALSDRYEQARYAVGAEESLERKYRLEPGPDVRARYDAVATSLADTLQAVRAMGTTQDRLLVDQVIADHAHYRDAVSRMFAAVDAGDTPRVKAIDAAEVDPVFEAIEQRVDAAAMAHRTQALRQLAALARTERFVLVATPIVFTAGLGLLVFFWNVLRRSRRSLDQAIQRDAQREVERVLVSTESEQRAVRRSEARFRALVEHASDVVSVLDADGIRTYASPAYERILGIPPEDLLGRHGADIVHPDDAPRAHELLAALARTPGAVARYEVRVLHRDGSQRWLEVVVTNRLEDRNVGGIVINSHDVTERKAVEAQLRHQALHDPLTDLPNRTLFLDRLSRALDRAGRHRHRPAVVPLLFLDLDGFKVVNDSLGHDVGDRLLCLVAERVTAVLRSGDLLARFGGDEFAVLLEPGTGPEEATRVAGRLLTALAAPFPLNGHEAVIGASIGIVVSSAVMADPGDLLRAADVALYRAKAAGKGGMALFDPRHDDPALGRLALESELRHAAERGELGVVYQPVIHLATGAIVGVEALIRWQHPARGLLPPEAFVPLAEETGLILAIGVWLRAEACRQVRAWQAHYPDDPPLHLSVNLSPREFRQPSLIADLDHLLRATGLRPDGLTLEVTETTAIATSASAITAMWGLKTLGVRLAIDDFGTGYASLNALKRFPIDELKIDRSFVAGLGQEQEDTAIVRATVGVAKALGLGVTAEGVETTGQVDQLRELGCDRGQGFVFAPPLAAADMEAWLRARRGSGADVA